MRSDRAVTLRAEDFINSSSTTAMSSVPVQFLIHVVNPPVCTEQPEIIGIPTDQSCISVQVGIKFTTQIIAINHCSNESVTISDIATLSFPGVAKSNLVKYNSTVYYKNLTYTAIVPDLGVQVICAMAYDRLILLMFYFIEYIRLFLLL
ncbi:unnamed protein product [Didymodactylos carnosus]|uniref:Uncharacterized protein n=1 Tax=Didymodactylos carnosus TaxID=1234261 RepID=A0A815AZL6_9BILA|nr:unnamed protein product [Didymodactylos carnosus]CAF4043020.1 unnamed protein product [Didymodactylos carnosus]